MTVASARNMMPAFALLTALLCVLPAGPVAGQDSQSSLSAVKDLLANMWARLRAATPRPAPAAPAASVTAGLRGAEATESDLKPYWRGDREQDASSRTERLALESAQALADAGKFAESARAFEAFLQDHPRSTLVPQALFGSGLARAALGDKARASAAFDDFIKRQPQHPLAKDAEQALAALR